MTIRQWLVTLALAGFLLTFPVGLVLPLFVGPTDWAGVLFVGGLLSLAVGFVLAGGVPKNARARDRAQERRRVEFNAALNRSVDAAERDSNDVAMGIMSGVGPYGFLRDD